MIKEFIKKINIKNNENIQIFDIYFRWKELNLMIKSYYTRGLNLHEIITETLCCIINDYKLMASKGGSEDAISKDNRKVQIKATSNFYDDLTSFGPRSEFDILEFMRLDIENDRFYCYRIDINYLNNILVNHNLSFNEQKKFGKRPRFSIIKSIINKNNLKEYAIIDMNSGDVYFKGENDEENQSC
ncbi:Bsp6I family restriction endonuclease [Metamycoplasma spumans]|uniref:Bsp6I family restriction endonuclease n=1 Tax=Metamycoplasma spumans TaxID=92406 RepID=UPI0034DCDF71